MDDSPKPKTTETIARKLQEALDQQGLTAAEVARRAGLGPTAVRDILIGKSRAPTIVTLEKIGGVLHLDIADMLDPRPTDPTSYAAYFALSPERRHLVGVIIRAMLADQELEGANETPR